VARIAWVGGLTYPLYLLHENIGFVLFETGNTLLGLNRWVVLGTTVAVITTLAWWLHVAVETRFARPLSARVYGVWVRLKVAAATAAPARSSSGALVDRAARHGYTPTGQLLHR
jgi:peptidoglycan/LPS O-acetylase OafA/YrhL